MMKIHPSKLIGITLLATLLGGCDGASEPETQASEPATEPQAFELAPSASANVFGSQTGDQPLPADQVFFPEADLSKGQLNFRIQTLPGHYLYKDQIEVRALDEGVDLGEPNFLTEPSIVTDEWFGEQAVFYIEAAATANVALAQSVRGGFDIELTYRGCKEDGICYLPVTRVLPVALHNAAILNDER